MPKYSINSKFLLLFTTIGISVFAFCSKSSSAALFTIPCNTLTPLVNTPGNQHVIASVEDPVGSLIPLCLGNVSGVGNLVDNNTSNSASVQMTGLLCDAVIAVKDQYAYPAHSFAGFEIQADGLIGVNVSAEVDIITLLNGVEQERQTLVTSLIGINLSLVDDQGHVQLGFMTNQAFDEVRIEYRSLTSVLFSSNVYFAFVKEFCSGVQLDCDTTYTATNPSFPVQINTENTGPVNQPSNSQLANAGAVITDDLEDFATLSIEANSGDMLELSVYNTMENFPAGVFAGFAIRDTNSMSETELRSTIQICLYRNGIQVDCGESEQLLNNLIVNPIIGDQIGGLNYSFGIRSSNAFDEIRLRVHSHLTLDQVLEIYAPFVTTRLYYTSTIHIDPSAAGTSTGLSWLNAVNSFNDLCPEDFEFIDTIKLTNGLFTPIVNQNRTGFYFNSNIVIVGGFDKFNPSIDTFNTMTILSGDLGILGNSSDNAYHVLHVGPLSNDFQLYNVLIQDGYADGASLENQRGAGIIIQGQAHLENLTVSNNFSIDEGAGIWIDNGGNLVLVKAKVTDTNSSNSGVIFGNDDNSETLILESEIGD